MQTDIAFSDSQTFSSHCFHTIACHTITKKKKKKKKYHVYMNREMPHKETGTAFNAFMPRTDEAPPGKRAWCRVCAAPRVRS